MSTQAVETGRGGGISMSNPVHFPSSRRLHTWGGAHISSLAAPPPFPHRMAHPPISAVVEGRVVEGRYTQRTISLTYPLSSRADQIVGPPSTFVRPPPNASVMKSLSGAAEGSPRLRPFDRTVHQPVQDTSRATSYVMDYCRPTAMRTTTFPPIHKRMSTPEQTAAALNWVGDDERTAAEIAHVVRFGLTPTAALDTPYHPAKHNVRAITKPKHWEDEPY